jgi:hypothetical protein
MNTEYRIVLVNKTDRSKSSPIAETENGGTDGKDTSGKDKGQEKDTSINPYVFYKKNIAPYVKRGLQYQIGTIALRTGNHELQARMQAGYDIASQTVGFVESVAVGAKVGGAWGAAIAAVLSVLNTAITLSQKIETFNINRNLENTSIALMNVRAGGNVATTSGRRR